MVRWASCPVLAHLRTFVELGYCRESAARYKPGPVLVSNHYHEDLPPLLKKHILDRLPVDAAPPAGLEERRSKLVRRALGIGTDVNVSDRIDAIQKLVQTGTNPASVDV